MEFNFNIGGTAELQIERYKSMWHFKRGIAYSITKDKKTLAEGLLTNSGGDRMWSLFTGAGGTVLNNANSFIGVGSSTTTPVVTGTALGTPLGGRKPCSTGYPKLGVAGGLTARQAQWRAIFDTGDSVGSWQEFGLFDALTSGTLIDHFLSNQGSKPSTQVWAVQLTFTVA